MIAIATGLLGILFAVVTPILPVKQDAASISWPQAGAKNLTAPLVSYTPLTFDASVPTSTIAQLGAKGGTLLSTVPVASGKAATDGLVIKVEPGKDGAPATVSVVQRLNPLLRAQVTQLGPDARITLHSDSANTRAEITDSVGSDGKPLAFDVPRDLRPQVVGIFTDLNSVAVPGLSAHLDVDSRFSMSPSALKLAAIALAVVLTLASLVALHLLDGDDGRRARRFLPAHWWRVTPVDAVVVGTLVLWHFVGANTSDDGYILNMARVSEHAGYMANYFRWFGVPEAPFGWYYDVLTWMTRVSDASPWMRLPALLCALICWMVISREVLPRLGARVSHNKVALWTAGLVFLAFWLPYNNGLRPEPIIALGALLTWASIERAIATRRLLPAAVAVLIAAFSLAAGPTGLIAVAALIAGSRPVLQIIIQRGRGVLGYLSLLAPGVAAGTLVLVVVFADQSLAAVRESTRVRKIIGPNVAWFDERYRWDSLMTISPDGSLARRFGVFVMLLCLLVCILVLVRGRGRIPGTSRGPSARILGIVFASLFLMWFTPTKWTHHFGVYAGLAGSLAALAAVAVGTASIRSRRNRTLFAAAVAFLLAMCFTSSNGWWYVSSYGVPWWDKPPMVAGKGFSTVFLGLTVLLLLLAAWHHYREPYLRANGRDTERVRRFAPAPLTIAAAFVVLFEVASLLKGAVSQYPAYSVARSNLDSAAGDICGLANDVLVETDPNADMLRPITGSVADGLSASNTGFTPNGVAEDLTADQEEKTEGTANTIRTTEAKTTDTTGAGTGGGTEAQAGVNGSTVMLPFGLDPKTTPVLGSYQQGEQKQASLTTQWYGLDRGGPVLAITAAGRIRSVDKDGVVTYGQDLRVEYGTRGANNSVHVLGSVVPYDIGPSPSWRNLRVPLDEIPSTANVVRLVAVDNDITPKQWLAVTPPRVPKLRTLQDVVGSQTPVLLDWSVGLAFPCQRPFDHHDGVAEVPQYRILPDRVGADATNAWQDHIGGGPLGWTELLLSADTMPTYLNHDWRRDWGSLEKFTPYVSGAEPAELTVTRVTRSGLWNPEPIRVQ
ncbi:arabinosyltransferase [Skermania sp. ID1734]|nr:arabinosyltransferase [Skermania sp. ID1734]